MKIFLGEVEKTEIKYLEKEHSKQFEVMHISTLLKVVFYLESSGSYYDRL